MPGAAFPLKSDVSGIAAAACGNGTESGMRDKLVLFTTLTVLVTLLYFGTLHSSLFDAVPVPLTALDLIIPFVPLFIFPYVSFFLLILLPLVVIDDPQELRDVAFGFSLIVVLSSVIFLFWPTMFPADATAPLWLNLSAVDGDRNALCRANRGFQHREVGAGSQSSVDELLQRGKVIF